MSAQLIFDTAPLGAIIRYSNGSPRPPERHCRKLPAWENRNNTGRLVKMQEGARVGQTILPESFTLHEGDYGTKALVVLKVFKTFSLDSDLDFTVIERPSAGSVLVLSRPGDAGELVHVAVSRAAADDWLSRHGYPDAVLHEVTADQEAADHVEGRAA